jgi:hypothetical protein
MDNPFLTPPQVESPQSRSWGLGFLYGFQGPAQSTMTPADIQPEDADAFDQGVLAGQDTAINGLPLSNTCLDLNVEGPSFSPEMASGLGEGAAALWELAHLAYAGAILSGVLAVVELSMALETHFDNPNDKLRETATALQQQLASAGFSEGMQLFTGGGIDTTVAGCELQLTPIHRDQDAATAAASGLGRPEWLIASWRSDQSGGVTIVATSS